MLIIELKDWIILIVAIWGAGLSTFLAFFKLYENRRKLEIKIKRIPVIPGLGEGDINKFKDDKKIQCVNKSKRHVQIKVCGLKTPLGEINFDEQFVSIPPSRKLMDGEGVTMTFDANKMLSEIAKHKTSKSFFENVTEVQGFVIDVFDKKHISKEKINFDIRDVTENYNNSQ